MITNQLEPGAEGVAVKKGESESHRCFLFLQGPITPFFRDIANQLEQAGCRCLRINLCFGDWLFWRGRESTQYRGSREAWPKFLRAFIDEHAVTDLILLGEQRYYHKVAIALAQERDIQVVTTDFGYLRPDWITFEKNGMSGNSVFPSAADEVFELAQMSPELSDERAYNDSFFRQVVWDMQYHLLSTLLRPLYPGYRSHQLHHPIFVYLGTGLRLLLLKLFRQKRAVASIQKLQCKNTRYVVFPLQMQNDFQIRAYSKYDNIQQALREVFESFSASAPADMQLVVKIHPLDPGLVNWSRCCKRLAQEFGLGDRIVYIDGGSLDTLIEGAEGVVTINSTVGVWALRQHKPLCVLGQAIYRIPGLVSESLNDFWAKPLRPNKALVDVFLRGIASHLHVRGVYYNQPGLANAVDEASRRLLLSRVNAILPEQTSSDQSRVA